MKTSAHQDSVRPVAPAVHLEFIQNQIGLPENAGLDEVEAYHRALFLHHHAQELEECRQQARTHAERLVHLEARLNGTQRKLADLEPLVPVHLEGEPDIHPSSPWNAWDRTMFVAAALGILSLLIFGILNISFNLLESGLVTFIENPARAYFWAALLPVGALAVKVGWDSLRGARSREIYYWSCLALGVAGVLAWLAAYALVYPTLSQTATEHLESLSVFDEGVGGVSSAGVKWIDAITVTAQAAAEIFLSAVLGMYMTTLYLRHRPVRLASNPLFTQLDEQRRLLEQSVESERRALAEAQGTQARLENQLAALLSFARSLFHKESGLRRDESRQKQMLLDRISEQLRSQLQSVGNGRLTEPGQLGPDATSPHRQP